MGKFGQRIKTQVREFTDLQPCVTFFDSHPSQKTASKFIINYKPTMSFTHLISTYSWQLSLGVTPDSYCIKLKIILVNACSTSTPTQSSITLMTHPCILQETNSMPETTLSSSAGAVQRTMATRRSKGRLCARYAGSHSTWKVALK